MIVGSLALDAKTAQFIKQLADKLREDRIFESVTHYWEKNKEASNGRWDTPARRKIGKIAYSLFAEIFSEKDAADYFYVEGEFKPAGWRKPENLFGSAGVYPDMAILSPKRVAIELDHSERGSGLKMALAKAGFNCLSNEWDCCFLFFYDESGKLNVKGKTEAKILKDYEEKFNTKILFFQKQS